MFEIKVIYPGLSPCFFPRLPFLCHFLANTTQKKGVMYIVMFKAYKKKGSCILSCLKLMLCLAMPRPLRYRIWFRGALPFDWLLARKAPFTAIRNLSFVGKVYTLFERGEFARIRKQMDSCGRVPFSLVLFLIELRMDLYPHSWDLCLRCFCTRGHEGMQKKWTPSRQRNTRIINNN